MAWKYRFALLTTLAGLAPVVAVSYPISPEPLWSLTSQAELIVVAEVAGVEDLPRDEDSWDSASARLEILETLKGPELSAVDVPYPATMICPAPPRYLEGETVVAFLMRDGDAWRTVALSYGTLYPQGAELEDMRNMIAAALAIQKQEVNPRILEHRKREWLVQAAALPGTRWHGLYELAPGTDRIRSSYDQSGRSGQLRTAPRHRELLAEALVKTPKMDPTLGMMLRVLGDHEDSRVDQVSLGALEGLLALEEPPWWVQDLLWTVLARFGDTHPEARLKELGVESWEVTPEQLRSLWAEAKSELGLPEVAPTEIDLERYLPVGGRTPS